MKAGAKPAVQKRSQQTRDKLIDALDSLLTEKDFEDISIADIALRAGVSTASIYQRFRNRDAAVSILLELYLKRVREWGQSAHGATDLSKASSLREALIMVGISAWRQVETLGHVMRPAYLYSRLRPDLLGDKWNAMAEQALTGFRSMLQTWLVDLNHDDLAKLAGMATYFYNMMFVGRLLHTDTTLTWKIPADEKAFASELADFVCGYLAATGKKL